MKETKYYIFSQPVLSLRTLSKDGYYTAHLGWHLTGPKSAILPKSLSFKSQALEHYSRSSKTNMEFSWFSIQHESKGSPISIQGKWEMEGRNNSIFQYFEKPIFCSLHVLLWYPFI